MSNSILIMLECIMYTEILRYIFCIFPLNFDVISISYPEIVEDWIANAPRWQYFQADSG